MKIDFDDLGRRECHELVVGMISPRPIAWVSTVGEDGTFNLAPFSFYGGVCSKPPMLCVSIARRRKGEKKDTVRNIEYTKDFVVNVVDDTLAAAMNQTSAEYPANVSEFKEVGLTPLASDKVRSPRVAECPISMECKVVHILELGQVPNAGSLVVGEIVRAHVKDALIQNGIIDPSRLKPVARLGADLYCRIGHVFEMKRPRNS